MIENLKINIVKNKKIIGSIAFYTILIVIWVFLFIKCKYGYGNLDETYFIQLAQRIMQGDSLLVEEWHPSQLFSYFTFPLCYLYLFLFKTTDGIILFFRIIYTFVWGISSLCIYNMLKKISMVGAMASSLMFLLYAPFSIMALSYNSLGILFLTMSCVLNIYKKTPFINILSGTFYSFSVICCPYLVFLLVYYFIYYLLFRKDKKQLLFFVLGIAIQFVIFCVFILSRTSISKIIDSLQFILDNPEYNDFNILSKISTYLKTFCRDSNIYIILFIVLVTVISYFSKKKDIFLLLINFFILILIFYMYKKYHYSNHLMFPFSLAIPFLLQFDDYEIKNIVWSICIPGIIYSFCLNLSSDQYTYAIFSALSIASIGSICAIYLLFKNVNLGINKYFFMSSYALLCLATLLQLSAQFKIRWSSTYWDADISQQTIMLKEGPEKGIYVTEDRRSYYEIIMTANNRFKFDSDNILFLTNEPLYYISNYNINSSAYSSWMVPSSYLQLSYYEINPHKVPDIIFYPSIEMGRYDEVLNALINKYGYKEVDWNDCGRVFKRQ